MAKVDFLGGSGGGPNISLSFDDSLDEEGTILIPQNTGPFIVNIPIPVGTNRLHKIRWNSITVDENGNLGISFKEVEAVRYSDGTLAVPMELAIAPGGFGNIDFGTSVDIVQAALPASNMVDVYYSWRWTRSPAFQVPFDIPVGN